MPLVYHDHVVTHGLFPAYYGVSSWSSVLRGIVMVKKIRYLGIKTRLAKYPTWEYVK